MGEQVKLTASDGHELSGYAARPEGISRGGVVVVQEIFGVNSSIRGVVDDYAAQGYTAIAPAIFDRFARGVDIGYGPEDMKVAFGYYGQLSVEKALLDIAAAFRQLKTDGVQAAAVTGFCYGGLMSWLSATRGEAEGMNLACTIGYYAGGVGGFAKEDPACPVMLHFGAADSHIGADQVDAVRSAHPEVEINLYEGAGHGFANPMRAEYVPEQAKLARERTLAFLAKRLG